MCAEELIITNVAPEEDSANLHPSAFDECKLAFGKAFVFAQECSIPYAFEPTEARAYSAKYVIEWEQAITEIKEKQTIQLSGVGRVAFQAGKSPVMLFGEASGNHTFTVDGQSVTCTSAVFEKASLATPANTIPGVTASYNGCSAFGFSGAAVKMNNCTFEFLTPNTGLNGNIALRCGATPATVNVSVFGSECSVSFGESGNTNLSKLTYKNNNPSAGKVLVTAAVNGITATKNKDNGLCPLSGTGTVTNATYNGPVPVQGTSGIAISIA
jgi:hypothetical protein